MNKLKCPYCRSQNTKKNGTRKDGSQKIYCNDCHKSFNPDTKLKPKNYLINEDLIKSVKRGHFEVLLKKLDTYEKLLDKYISLTDKVEGFIDKINLELETPNVSTINNIQSLVGEYDKIFKSKKYDIGVKKDVSGV